MATLAHADARIIAHGLLHDGIRVDRLTDKAHKELRAAIEKLIEVVDIQWDDDPATKRC